MLMIGIIMGTGVMGLPAAMAKLGWVLGLGSIVVFGLFSAYAALLLSHTRNTHYPQVNSFADLATEVVGPRFGALTRVLIIANWASLLPYYLMAAVSSIESASRAVPALHLEFAGAAVDLPDVHLCYWQWALVLMAVLLIPLQIRTLGSLSGLAAVSDAAVVLALLLMLSTFATMPMPEARALAYANVTAAGDCTDGRLWCAVSNAAQVASTQTSLWPAADVTFLDAYGSFSSFIFAFQGHSIFLEIMGQMNPATVAADFRAATIGANLGMGAVYALTCAVAYVFVGADVKGFLPFSLPDSSPAVKVAVGLLLCFHILVSYLLTAQPLTEYLREQVWILLCGDGGRSLKHRMGARSALKKGAMILPDREQEDDEVVEADLEGGGISACVDGSSSSGGSSGSSGGSSTSGSGVGTALGHLLLTVGLLGFAFLVANAVPFFSDFQNIIGSALGAPILFGWPPLLYLAAERKNGDPGSMLYSRGDPNLERVPLATKLICWLSLYVMLPMCFVLGLVSAIQMLIVDWETFGKPFDCVLAGY
jgi:vesicular inhibitory amino acid transporter